MKYIIKKIAVGSMLAISLMSQAQATIYTTLFTNASAFDTTGNGGNLGLSLISGAPTGTFATLTYNSFTNVFSLSAASNLDAFFGAGAFIDAIAFNTPQPRSQFSDAAVSGGGIDNFVESNGGPNFGAGDADDFNVTYSFEFNDNNASLVQGESVGFTIAGLNPNCFTSDTCVQNSTVLPATTFAIRLTRNPSGNNNTAIAWASGASIDPVSAVPEAETTAMFLAGLGLLSLVSRRRIQA